MRFDVNLINPLGGDELMYAVIADSPEQAMQTAPILLSSSSQWRPDQFTVTSAKISIYEDNCELRQHQNT